MAACQPSKLRHAAARKRRARNANSSAGKGRRVAAHVPPASADRLLFEPVSFLSERNRRRFRISGMVAPGATEPFAVTARTVPLRRARTGLSRNRPKWRARLYNHGMFTRREVLAAASMAACARNLRALPLSEIKLG